ncbi:MULTISPECIES: hypothetical protein [Enterococcus]|uniref:Uncharacterized protein n=1 Tax=Enterococcus sulfureus ATCC 49903 TaxID=1140003 RepID=S0NZZ6_9ENTE|nr:hypothetical protein [Enterococcus sulfureus]EOT47210.1 hypothetical protein OMY_01464 [Enterococcus sulfureus ATCC 49903]EOT83495.1 hypothetical protein I573_01216 [Enterococcus sulfureus ATCC 49903]
MIAFVTGLIGVLVGAAIVTFTFNLRIRYDERKEKRQRELDHRIREIETLVLLNKKINEILEKRMVMMDKYLSFDAFDDCYISVDDYIYLQSFTAQNSFYLPNYFVEEFFKKIATRKVVLSPEETVQYGGYAFKGGRMLMESFSDEIKEMIYERKNQVQQMTDQPYTYFSKPL